PGSEQAALDCFAALAMTMKYLVASSCSAQHRDETMQRLGGGLLVLHHGDADVVGAGIAAVLLLARKIAARNDAQPALAPQPQRRRLAAALRGDVEPEEKSARGPAIAVA